LYINDARETELKYNSCCTLTLYKLLHDTTTTTPTATTNTILRIESLLTALIIGSYSRMKVMTTSSQPGARLECYISV